MDKLSWLAVAVSLAGCAHSKLSAGDLNRVSRPAFVTRTEEGAGPFCRVFAEDGSYRDKLKGAKPAEADRSLVEKLTVAVSRFEVSDRLRAVTLANLPKERPWTHTVDPVAVAGVLQSFLVQEVPARTPDYELLKPLGADAVVEFVVQQYGMRSRNGHAGAYVAGYGRMFFIGGSEIWRSAFTEDQIQLGEANLDPFEVIRRPELFRDALSTLLDRAATELAGRLTPRD